MTSSRYISSPTAPTCCSRASPAPASRRLRPPSWRPSTTTLPQELSGLMLITVHPDHVATAVLSLIETIITVGDGPEQAIRAFSAALQRSRDGGAPREQQLSPIAPIKLEAGEALF